MSRPAASTGVAMLIPAQWKLSEIDVQAQEHWDDFTAGPSTRLRRTST